MQFFNFLVVIWFTIVPISISESNIKEQLTIKALTPLQKGKFLATFTFNITTEEFNSETHSYSEISRPIGEILHSFSTRELFLSITQGTWDSRKYGDNINTAPPGAQVLAWFENSSK
jgi:phosphatidylinositol glycan class T